MVSVLTKGGRFTERQCGDEAEAGLTWRPVKEAGS